MKCPKCNHELLLDHVITVGSKKEFWYTCINHRCEQCGKAFSPSGGETESVIKTVK